MYSLSYMGGICSTVLCCVPEQYVLYRRFQFDLVLCEVV
jgi:hypothetical protein